jgi:NAD(P)H-dependent flavin oxidoreductase YrpB (nitropropane dioxygenase family)
MSKDVTSLLKIDYPVLAFSHCRDVVAAVSQAGGFGVLGAVAHSPERLQVDLDWIEEQVGDRPYGVDLLLPEKYVGSDAGGLSPEALASLLPPEHQRFLDDLLDRYGVGPLPEGSEKESGFSMHVSPEGYGPLLDVAFDHKISLLASALGPAPAEVIDRAHDRGVLMAALAGSLHHAERHVATGVDLIVAQGTEAGGHTGQVSTMVLVPEVVDVASPVPVLAAGGIARGRQVAAAMALGAAGVWTGSVWLTTEEAETLPAVKQKFLSATSSDTIRSRSITGKPARMLKSAWTEAWEAPDAPDTLGMPLQPLLVSSALARINRVAHQEGTGASQLANYFVGQVVGSLKMVRPARRVLLDMMEEYAETLARLGSADA